MSRTFYDTYANTYPAGTDLSYKPTHTDYLPALAQTISNPIGRATVVKTAVLNENQTVEKYIYATTYFDALGRTVQAQATNHKDNTVDITSSDLDFVGRVRASKLSTQGHIVEQRNSYDVGGRMAAVCQKTDTYDYWEPIARNHFSPMGELTDKQIGCDTKGQKVDYGYNVRGWLLNINNPEDLPAGKDLFGMKLSYHNAATNPLYNGNITELSYATAQHDATITANYAVKQGDAYNYKFTYDNLDRLLTGKLDKKKVGASSFTPYFELTGMQYDLNGNIKNLNRSLRISETDANLTAVDQLAYNYEGNTTNRLKGVKDNSSHTTYFNDKNGTDDDYEYDFAGNITKDNNKTVSLIKYNHSNLPYQITVGGTTGGTIKYWYGAGGQKVRKIVDYTAPAKPDKVSDYVAGLVYETSATLGNAVLEFIPTAEGRAVLKTNIYKNADGSSVTPPSTGGAYLYEYSLKDHLGNLRVACRCGDPTRDATGNITAGTGSGTEPLRNVQENHYDPWGMSLGTPPDQKQANLNNRYQYNGKEIVEDFDLSLYEYGARNYDAILGRWNSVDPLADEYANMTPYNYALNSPFNYIDPDGRSPISVLAKMILKLGAKKAIKEFAEKQIKKRLESYMSKQFAKQFAKDLDGILNTLDSEWWEVALELVPVAGDIYGGTKFGIKIAKAYEKLQDLENKYVEKIYDALPEKAKKEFKEKMRTLGVKDAQKDQKSGVEIGDVEYKKGSKAKKGEDRSEQVDGHHKKKVETSPGEMADPRNIKFMKHPEHKKHHQENGY